jgi:hypothetical protein
MSDPDPEKVESRANLLPEEERAGSDDPEAQAEAILDESEARTRFPVPSEERRSEDTVDPS